MFSVLLALGWIRFQVTGLEVSAAVIVALALLIYYFVLDLHLAVAMTAVIGVLWWLSEAVVAMGAQWSSALFLVTFVGGWILQLVGHGFEGRRPAFMDNLFQIFVAPIFLMAEVFFAFGFRLQFEKKFPRSLIVVADLFGADLSFLQHRLQVGPYIVQ